MSMYLKLLILCLISAGVLALAVFGKRVRLGTALCFVWLAASLPLCFFLALDDKSTLLFYLITALLGFAYLTGGKHKS